MTIISQERQEIQRDLRQAAHTGKEDTIAFAKKHSIVSNASRIVETLAKADKIIKP